jgi:hypothetical protein
VILVGSMLPTSFVFMTRRILNHRNLTRCHGKRSAIFERAESSETREVEEFDRQTTLLRIGLLAFVMSAPLVSIQAIWRRGRTGSLIAVQ